MVCFFILWVVFHVGVAGEQCRDTNKQVDGQFELNRVINTVEKSPNGWEPHKCCKSVADAGTNNTYLFERCADFCKNGIPVTIGTCDVGFTLQNFDEIAFESGLLKFDPPMLQKCSDWSTALESVKKSAAELTYVIEKFTYAKLDYRAAMKTKMKQLRVALNSESTQKEMGEANEPEKIGLLRRIIRDNIRDSLNSNLETSKLENIIKEMEKKAAALKDKLDTKLPDLTNFATECTKTFLGYSPRMEYLLDVCKRTESCMDNNASEHVGCVCGIIPATYFYRIDPSNSEKRRLDVTDTKSVGETDTCGEAYIDVDGEIEAIVEDIALKEEGDRILAGFGNEQRDAYPLFYSECNSRRLESSSDIYSNTSGAGDTASQAEEARRLGSLLLDHCEPPRSTGDQGSTETLTVAFTTSTKANLCKLLSPKITYDRASEMCERFCAPSSLPFVLGHPEEGGYGFEQKDMDKICLSPETDTKYSTQKVRTCIDKGRKFIAVQEKTADLVAKLYILDAEQLLLEGKAQQAARRIQDKIQINRERIEFVSGGKEQKLTVMKEVVKNAFDEELASLSLQDVVADARSAGSDLNSILDSSLNDIRYVLDNCNELMTGVGPNHEYLLDLCSQTGINCIEAEAANHVGCCCAFNPVASIGERIQDVDGIPSTIEGWGARRLEVDDALSPMNICGEADKQSRSNVTERKRNLTEMGYAALWEEMAAIREAKYPAYHRRCNEAPFDISVSRRRAASLSTFDPPTVSNSTTVGNAPSTSIIPSALGTSTSPSSTSEQPWDETQGTMVSQISFLIASGIMLYVCGGVELTSHF